MPVLLETDENNLSNSNVISSVTLSSLNELDRSFWFTGTSFRYQHFNVD